MRQVYISGVLVNTLEDVPYSITRTLSDIKDPASRSASYTTTINIVGDKDANKLFGSLFILNKDNSFETFNPKVKVPAYVAENGLTIIEGYAQLLNIKRDDNRVVYEVVIYSSAKNLFSLMGDNYITGNTTSGNNIDLDSNANIVNVATSAYNETSANGFVNSSNVCEAMFIENGLGQTTSSYPFLTLDYKQQRLAVKFRHIWDRIFLKHSCLYTSSFISSSGFSPYVYVDTHSTLPKLSSSQSNNLSCVVNRTLTGSAFDYTTTAGTAVDFNNERRDAGSLYNIGTDIFTSNSRRSYLVKANVIITPSVLFSLGKGTGIDSFTHTFNLGLYKNGTLVLGSTVTAIRNQGVTGTVTSGTSVSANAVSIPIERSVDVASGDTLQIRLLGSFNNQTPIAGALPRAQFTINSIMTIEPTVNEITVGERYFPSTVIANQHKQKDFILDVIKMFNMYLLFDEETQRYIVEPRDAFYELGNEWDLTNYVDRSQTINIKPVGELTWKELRLKPTADKDYYSELYVKNWGEVYGQQNVLNDNEFVNETKEVELYFSPPMLVSALASHPKLHHIYTFDGSTRKAIDGRARYGYWGGWVESNSVQYNIKDINSTDNLINGYAYVGEFNNPNTPTISALFGSPREIFYRSFDDIAITTNNLYKYYESMLLNQIDLNAKIVECQIVYPIFTSQFKLYDTVILDGIKCTISKLESSSQVTNLELIQYER